MPPTSDEIPAYAGMERQRRRGKLRRKLRRENNCGKAKMTAEIGGIRKKKHGKIRPQKWRRGKSLLQKINGENAAFW
ncbi:MAG: hypothetical protein HAW59_02365 [Betaproteobacteria bacterium]|nr:hypothetical protein [Betaproteobacteria bacterium]